MVQNESKFTKILRPILKLIRVKLQKANSWSLDCFYWGKVNKHWCPTLIQTIISGRYYKHITIVSDDSRVVSIMLHVMSSPTIVILTSLEVSLTLQVNINSTGVNHDDSDVFIVQGTGVPQLCCITSAQKVMGSSQAELITLSILYVVLLAIPWVKHRVGSIKFIQW
jgi:hypothetical protein